MENLSILTNATYKHSQNKTVVAKNYDKSPSNVPFGIPKSLFLSNDYRDDFLSDKNTFVPADIVGKPLRLKRFKY